VIDSSHRFHGHNSLNFAYRQGRSARSEFLNLKYVLNNRRKDYRVAVVVAKKVHKSAVMRNRLRRRLYTTIRESLPADTANYDLIFSVVSDKLIDTSSSQMAELINDLLTKAGIKSLTAGPQPHDIVSQKEN
jgi:ribonuclease P protein component